MYSAAVDAATIIQTGTDDRVTYDNSQTGEAITGFDPAPSSEGDYEHLVHGDGTFYACWENYNIYGPSPHYRGAGPALPVGCVDVELLPKC